MPNPTSESAGGESLPSFGDQTRPEASPPTNGNAPQQHTSSPGKESGNQGNVKLRIRIRMPRRSEGAATEAQSPHTNTEVSRSSQDETTGGSTSQPKMKYEWSPSPSPPPRESATGNKIRVLANAEKSLAADPVNAEASTDRETNRKSKIQSFTTKDALSEKPVAKVTEQEEKRLDEATRGILCTEELDFAEIPFTSHKDRSTSKKLQTHHSANSAASEDDSVSKKSISPPSGSKKRRRSPSLHVLRTRKNKVPNTTPSPTLDSSTKQMMQTDKSPKTTPSPTVNGSSKRAIEDSESAAKTTPSHAYESVVMVGEASSGVEACAKGASEGESIPQKPSPVAETSPAVEARTKGTPENIPQRTTALARSSEVVEAFAKETPEKSIPQKPMPSAGTSQAVVAHNKEAPAKSSPPKPTASSGSSQAVVTGTKEAPKNSILRMPTPFAATSREKERLKHDLGLLVSNETLFTPEMETDEEGDIGQHTAPAGLAKLPEDSIAFRHESWKKLNELDDCYAEKMAATAKAARLALQKESAAYSNSLIVAPMNRKLSAAVASQNRSSVSSVARAPAQMTSYTCAMMPGSITVLQKTIQPTNGLVKTTVPGGVTPVPSRPGPTSGAFVPPANSLSRVFTATQEDIQRAIPENASCVVHVMDRRVNLDSCARNASFYSLLRSWVQDDPFRQIASPGINILASMSNSAGKQEEQNLYTVLPKKRRLEKNEPCNVLNKLNAKEQESVPLLSSLRDELIASSKRLKRENRKEDKAWTKASRESLKSMGIELPAVTP